MSLAEDLLNLLLKKDKPKTTAPKPVVAEPQGMGQQATPPASPMQNIAATVVPTLSQLPVQSASMGFSIPSMRQDPELEDQTIGARKELTAKLLEQLKSQEAAKDLQGFMAKSRLQAFTPQLDVTPGLAFLDAQLGTNVAKSTPAPKSLEEALTEQAQLQGQVAQQERGLTDNVREALATFQNDQAARDNVRLAIANANALRSDRNAEMRAYENVQKRIEPISKTITDFDAQRASLLAAAESGDAQQITSSIQTLIKLSGGAANSSDKENESALIRDINGFIARLKQKFGGDIAKASPAELLQFKNSVQKFINARTEALTRQILRLKQRESSGPYGRDFLPGGYGDAAINSLLTDVGAPVSIPGATISAPMDSVAKDKLLMEAQRQLEERNKNGR